MNIRESEGGVWGASHYTIIKTGDGSNTLLDSQSGETFHSRQGAVEEAKHVFLKQSGLAQRFDAARPVRVLEVGFGTGLNFFLSSSVAEKAGAPLIYAALENNLLPAQVIDSLGWAKIARCGVVDAFLEWRLQWKPTAVSLLHWGLVKLRMLHGDATKVLLGKNSYDIIYHHAFKPGKDSYLWQPIFIGKLYDSLASGGCLVTNSGDEDLRKRLVVTGFKVEMAAGLKEGDEKIMRALKLG